MPGETQRLYDLRIERVPPRRRDVDLAFPLRLSRHSRPPSALPRCLPKGRGLPRHPRSRRCFRDARAAPAPCRTCARPRSTLQPGREGCSTARPPDGTVASEASPEPVIGTLDRPAVVVLGALASPFPMVYRQWRPPADRSEHFPSMSTEPHDSHVGMTSGLRSGGLMVAHLAG